MDALYIVRVWSRRGSDAAWRATVEHVATRLRYEFLSPEQLLEFFARRLGTDFVAPPLSTGSDVAARDL
ncbi:MAG: hypothetical protein JO043_00780 [Candidatus Eremiobacteraeota bacterium]|nr:hypothetical protein [Candidatus Eremiobacteraeota bacterium]